MLTDPDTQPKSEQSILIQGERITAVSGGFIDPPPGGELIDLRKKFVPNAWVFKGGTCLKKCYFETYRFSEDLDFTVRDPAQLEGGFLLQRFAELSAWLYGECGIELPVELLRFSVWNNERGGRAGEGRISYRGPIAPRGGDLPRIKLDLTAAVGRGPVNVSYRQFSGSGAHRFPHLPSSIVTP